MAGPSQNPPLGNADAPINTGAGTQTKTGDLGVNNLNAGTVASTGASSATQFCLPSPSGCITAWNDPKVGVAPDLSNYCIKNDTRAGCVGVGGVADYDKLPTGSIAGYAKIDAGSSYNSWAVSEVALPLMSGALLPVSPDPKLSCKLGWKLIMTGGPSEGMRSVNGGSGRELIMTGKAIGFYACLKQ